MNIATDELARNIDGEVVLSGQPEYDRLRRTFVHSGTPAVIVRVAGGTDVATALRFARDNDLEISVRSGGHSNAGFSTNDGGLVIDLSLLNAVEVLDADRGRVRLGPGARWAEVGSTLLEHKLAVSSGDTTSVGVGGLLCGGGIGWMVRKYGLAIDSVRAVEIVTADGSVLRATAEENPDLFWAVRGGGANMGIVTSFELDAHREDGVHFGTITYPTAQAAQVVRGWAAYMRTAPEALTTTVARYPPLFGDFPLHLIVCYAGNDEEAATRAIEPLLRLGDPQSHEINLVPYPSVLEDASDLPPDWVPRATNRFVPAFTDEVADLVTTGWQEFDSLVVELRSMGGALGRPAKDATAFAHRDAEVMVNVANLGTAAENAEAAPRFEAFWRTLAPHVSGAYSNLISDVGEDDIAQCYPGETYARLAMLKAKYDPDNLFHRNVNITPAS